MEHALPSSEHEIELSKSLSISEGAEIFRRNASHEIVFRLQKTFFSNVRLKAIGDNTNAADPPQHDVVAPPFHIQLNKSSH